ncbi:unnamed protein product, partial [marine sediment metagenome]
KIIKEKPDVKTISFFLKLQKKKKTSSNNTAPIIKLRKIGFKEKKYKSEFLNSFISINLPE